MRKTRLKSVRSRLILLFLSIVLLALIALLIVITFNFGSILSNELEKEMDSALTQAAMHIDFIEGELQTLATNIGSNTTIQKLYVDSTAPNKQYIFQDSIREILCGYMYSTNYIVGIDVIYDDGTTFCTDKTQAGGIYRECGVSWVEDFLKSEKTSGFSNEIGIHLGRNAYQAIAFGMKFNNYYTSRDGYAAVVVYIRPEYLTSTLTDGLQNADSLVITNNEAAIYQKNADVKRKGSHYSISKEIGLGLTIRAEYSSGIALERYGQAFALILLITIGIAIVMCVVAVHSIRRWTKPIADLKMLTAEVAKGNFDVAAPPITDDEMGELTNSFIQMTMDLKKYIHQQLNIEKQRNELQMELQMAKINPHFIYNTLDSVIWLALMGKKEETADLCRGFVNILQDTLHTEGVGALSTLEQEISLVRNYEKIQRIRYGDRFRIIYEIEENVRNALIPKLTLQPLIENALFHGILPQDSKIGTIWIRGYQSGEMLVLETEDDGVGLSKTVRESLSAAEKTPAKAQMHSIGLSNIRKRLELLYPKSYKMYFSDENEKGTKIIIEIPRRNENCENRDR